MNPQVVGPRQSLQIGDRVAVAILARVEHHVTVDIQAHLRLQFVVVRLAVGVAVRRAFVRDVVAVQVVAGSLGDVPFVGNAV